MAPNAQTVALPHLAIVDKLHEFPLVNSALDYANSRYEALKHVSPLVNSTLEKAENTIQMVVTTGVVPVLNKLEQPIHYADNIAVQGLDLAVAKFDSIQKSSGEFKDTTRKVVDQTKERLSAARASAVQTVQARVHSVMTLPQNVVPLLDQILNAGENVLDYLMPEKDGNGASKPATNGTSTLKPEEAQDPKAVLRVVIIRVRAFTDRVQKRIVEYSRERWIPALFSSALAVQRNVLSLVANGAAAKILAAAAASSSNGHASPVPESNSTQNQTGPKEESNNSVHNSTPKKNKANSSSAAASASPASNGELKKQQQAAQKDSQHSEESNESVTSS